MVETTEIEIQTDPEKVYKTPSYIRAAHKRYREKYGDKFRKLVSDYEKKKRIEKDEVFLEKRRKIAKKHYNNNKSAITPEQKAAKAKYMREYRAKKKLEKETISS